MARSSFPTLSLFNSKLNSQPDKTFTPLLHPRYIFTCITFSRWLFPVHLAVLWPGFEINWCRGACIVTRPDLSAPLAGNLKFPCPRRSLLQYLGQVDKVGIFGIWKRRSLSFSHHIQTHPCFIKKSLSGKLLHLDFRERILTILTSLWSWPWF